MLVDLFGWVIRNVNRKFNLVMFFFLDVLNIIVFLNENVIIFVVKYDVMILDKFVGKICVFLKNSLFIGFIFFNLI